MKKKNNKKEELQIGKQFKEAKTYIRESKNYIYFSIVLFIFFAIIGFILSDYLTFLNEILRGLIIRTSGLNMVEMIFFILQNNFQSSLFSIVLGVGLGFIPVIYILINGTIMGYVLSLSYQSAGLVSWWRLLPHGIFELPAIFISFGLGIKLGFSFFAKNVVHELKNRLYQSMNAMLMIIIPLLIIAAIIEGALIILLS